MKNLLLLTLSLLLTLPIYASEKVFGNLEVESSLSVHDTADPIVFRVDSSTHRVGINKDAPSVALDVVGDTIVSGSVTAGNLTMSSGSITDTSGNITFGDENLTTTGTAFLGLIDLGTNTIDDLAMTGDWDFNSGIMDNFGGRVGIGKAAHASYQLDIQGIGFQGFGNSLQVRFSSNANNEQTQVGGFSLRHHDTSEEDVVGFLGTSNTNNSNQMFFGGGSASFNAATQLTFLTGATETTLGGVTRFQINSDGTVNIPQDSVALTIGAVGDLQISYVDGTGGLIDDTTTQAISFADNNLTTLGTLTVGADTNGADVKFFGSTSGKFMLWDESADQLDVSGTLNVTGSGTLSSILYPTSDGSANDIIKTDGAGTLAFVTATSHTQVSFSMYDAEPARGSETSLDGAFIAIATAQPLNSSPTDLVVSKGTGKLVVVINAGSDLAGDITVTGTSVNRDTGATTADDTDTLTVDALTTDNSDTDTNGNTRHAVVGGYITSKWFTGTVTLSTTNLTLTDVDVYHVSFEQFDDTANITLDTFDANILTTNVAADFDAYLYAIVVTGDKCTISREASLNVGADGETAIADRYWRLRRGNIAKAIDGTTDGTWVDVHYSNSPAYVEDVSIKVWATEIVALTLN